MGLGNPGLEYAWTRHNLGYQVVAALAELWRIPLTRRTLDNCWGQGRVGQETVILAQPSTYMNLSGRAVSCLMAYMKLSLEDLVVIHDDMDVPLGRLKIGKGGGAGGHRGVLSIIEILGTQEFLRVKLGIGRPPPQMSGESYVLSHFPLKEAETIVDFVVRAAQAVETLLEAGLAAAQHRFHGPPL